MASAEEVTLCAAHEGYRASVALPAGFRPFLERPDAPNLAPGAIPLILTRQGVICLAGNMRQSPGVMALEVSTGRHNFREAPPGGSITVFSPEEMAINHGNRVDFLGLERPAGRIGALASAMPLGRGRMWTSYFAAEGGGRLTVLGSIPFDIDLADAACHADSCCGVTEPAGGSLVVSYFSRGGSNAGLKFAVYRLENGGEDS